MQPFFLRRAGALHEDQAGEYQEEEKRIWKYPSASGSDSSHRINTFFLSYMATVALVTKSSFESDYYGELFRKCCVYLSCPQYCGHTHIFQGRCKLLC